MPENRKIVVNFYPELFTSHRTNPSKILYAATVHDVLPRAFKRCASSLKILNSCTGQD
jgi:hypothetical protein